MRLFRKRVLSAVAVMMTAVMLFASCDTLLIEDVSSIPHVPSTPSAPDEPSVPEGPSPEVKLDLNEETAAILGRASTADGGYTFSYGSSGFSVNFTGTEFWIYVPKAPKMDNNFVEVSVAVLIDSDYAMDAVPVTVNKTGWIRLAEGLTEGEHHIEVRKQNRSFYGIMKSDWLNVSQIGVNEGGEINPPDGKRDLVIEVYGDSVSNGAGVWNKGRNEAYTLGGYTGVIERLLNADVRVIANDHGGILGWSLAGDGNGKLDNPYPPQKSWNKFDPHSTIPEDYSHEGENAADVVIINLGTNDRVEYNNGDMTDAMFNDEYLRFIKQIKTDCPDAIVICTIGAMGGIGEFGDNMPKIIKDANEWADDTFCYFFELDRVDLITGGYGYDRKHPSQLAHEIYGLQLATLINGALNLNLDLPDDIPESAYLNNEDIKNPEKTGVAIDSGLEVLNDNVLENMFDGDMSTGWQILNKSEMGENCWAGMKFTVPVKCTGVTIVWEEGSRPSDDGGYKMEYSEDGLTWKTIPNISTERLPDDENGIYSTDVLSFPEISVMAIRVKVLYADNFKDYGSMIYEFEIKSAGAGDIVEGNIMNHVTKRDDNLTRVNDALSFENI